jgi:hypothetical protein
MEESGTDIREILRRLQLGESDRRIARDLGVGRNTVARYRLEVDLSEEAQVDFGYAGQFFGEIL